MELICPTCAARTAVPDERLPPEGTRARCGTCANVSIYYRGGLVADDPTPPQIISAEQMHQTGFDAQAAQRLAAMPSIALAVPLPREAPEEPAPAPQPAGPAKSIGWQIRTAAGDAGPLPVDSLKPMIRDGRLGPDDLACPPGAEAWHRAGDLPDLQRWFALQKKTYKAPTAEAPNVGAVASCMRHPGVRGRWMCQGCGDLSCDACVISAEVMRVQVKQCPVCRKACTELVPTKKIVPFWEDLRDVFTFPFRGLGWLALVIFPLMGIGAVISRHAARVTTIAWGAAGFLTLSIYAYHLWVIRTSTQGGRSMPNLGKIENYYDDFIKPAGKAAFVSFLLFIPAKFTYSGMKGAEAQVAFAQGIREGVIADQKQAELFESDPEAARAAQEAAEHAAGDAMNAALDDLAMGDVDAMAGVMGNAAARMDWREDRDYAEELRQADAALAEAKSGLTTRRGIHALVVGIALFFWPIFLIIVALFNTIVPAFQPQVLLKLIREIPRPYAFCTLMTSGCFIAIYLLNIPMRGSMILSSWLTSPLTYYFSLIAFYVMGRTAEMAEQEVDWH